MIDLNSEKLVPLAKAARELLDREVSPPTLWRWRTKGVRGVRLEVAMVGGQVHTTRESLRRFIERTTAAAEAANPSVDTSAPERSDATARRLKAAGLIG